MKRNPIRISKYYPTWNSRSLFKNYCTIALSCSVSMSALAANDLTISPALENLSNVEFSEIQRTISGIITDAAGNPLPGVNIIIEGTNVGTQTNFDGEFTIDATTGDVLVVSYIGMKTVKITVDSSNNTYTIALDEDAASLDEVVVVGYGKQSKTELSGSVASVESKELVQAASASATELLAGRVPGLITKQTVGTPGNDAPAINIRGFGDALVLVDGIQTSMDRIDPNDIESVSVLKDAAAAVYGSRAGNGVILVTTKRGKEGKTKISYHGNTSWQQPTKNRTYVPSWDYAQLVREADLNGGGSLDDTFTAEEVEQLRTGTHPNYVNEDWYGAVFKDWTPMQQHNLSVTGGTDKVKYYTSFGALDQESAYHSGDLDFQRYNLRSNLDVAVTDNLKAVVDMSYKREDRNRPATDPSTMFNRLQTAQPIYPAHLPDPTRAAYSGFTTRSPFADTEKDFGGYNDDMRELFTARVDLQYKFDFGLSARASINYQSLNTSLKALRRPFDIWEYDRVNDEYIYQGTANSRSSIAETYRKRIQMYPSFTLEYEKKWNDHKFKALALVESIDIKDESIWAKRFDLISTDIPYLSSGHPETMENDSNASESGRKSYVARLNYNYKGKYFLEGTMRADATGEKFHEDSRWGYFPSVSAAWRISEEDFMSEAGAVNNLKLRLSYSETGLDNVGNFRYLTGYSVLNPVYLIDDGAGQIIRSTGLPNENVTWLTNTLYNVGVDASFWNGKLMVEFDYFYRLTEGIFGVNQADIPSTFGAVLPQENINSRDDRGFDVVVTHNNNINADWSYGISANVGRARSKWVEYSEDEYTDPDDIRLKQLEGNYTNRIIGYVSDGLFMDQDQIDNHPVDQDQNGNSTLIPGDIIYKDLNGDGVIDERDQDDIGYGSTPDISYGLNLNASYKNFSISALFQGAGLFNMNITGAVRGAFSNGSTPYDFQKTYAWTPDYDNPGQNTNPDVRLPMITNNGVTPNNNRTSDFWLLDNTYLRLKTVNLTYSLPDTFVEKIGFSQFDVYGSATNLFSFNKLGIYKDSFDPEGPTNQNGRSYPIMRTVTLGLRLSI